MGDDEEFHVGHEAKEELKRLATHPVQEIRRLEEEAAQGDVGATPGIVLAGMSIWLGIVFALMLGIVLLVTFLVTR